ncbi:hypothetical protein Ocin01_14497 [Orchesella cincta]|uniref:Uncharacterized protein n=1 Tax=Orchesella cincta TaxID=48709 RepID=A0A1D2MGR5_ORCCI|nr:hypothetical protein Ocin01_14497 [Orchesella cincta]
MAQFQQDLVVIRKLRGPASKTRNKFVISLKTASTTTKSCLVCGESAIPAWGGAAPVWGNANYQNSLRDTLFIYFKKWMLMTNKKSILSVYRNSRLSNSAVERNEREIPNTTTDSRTSNARSSDQVVFGGGTPSSASNDLEDITSSDDDSPSSTFTRAVYKTNHKRKRN